METRFIAKQLGSGRESVWRVYDRQRAAYPYTTPELGKVEQDHATEAAAQTEADRLTAAHGGLSRSRGSATNATATKSTKDKAGEKGKAGTADETLTDAELVAV